MKNFYKLSKLAIICVVIALTSSKDTTAQTVVYGPHIQDAFSGNPGSLYTWDVVTSGALKSQDNTTGLLTVTTALQSGTTTINSVIYNKFRGDIKKTGVSATNLLQLDPSQYPIVAIKMSLPSTVQTNITFDTNLGSFGNGSNKYTGVVNTTDGRNVYYYDLSAASKYFGSGTTNPTNVTNNLSTFQFKVADVLSTETSNATAPTYQVDWIQTFASVADLMVAVSSVLPVNLTSYNASLQSSGNVSLTWNVSSEQNNSYFLVERKDDNNDFTEIGKISSKGNGASTYYFNDNSASSGKNYYRLSQVDNDGTKTELGVKAVDITLNKTKGLSVFPNPITGNDFSFTYATSNNEVSVRISDTSGKVVFSNQVHSNSAGAYRVNLLNKLPQGIYLLNVNNEATQKIVVK
ncbi:MAG TPA: DUF4979 domain-containing protein [Pelobium sp.]|nr:DUF4979 domain-containing protein [Pelobium sp.]